MFTVIKRHGYVLGIAFCVMLLLAKFFWSYFAYDVPLGYDVGMYRYLFLKHAEGFPPFFTVPLETWAKGHSLGLFFFTTVLLRSGMPVDWLIGPLWNAMSVFLMIGLAWGAAQSPIFTHVQSFSRRKIGVLTLLLTFLSIPLFDGFVAMYWKTYFSLFFVVLTFGLLDRKSYWAVVTGIIALGSHNQTGFLFVLALGTWWFVQSFRRWRDPLWRRASLLGLGGLIMGLLISIPVYQETIGDHILTLFGKGGVATPEGAFPEPLYYLQRYSIVIALGIVGFLYTLKKRQFSYWHTAALWSAVFVVARLFFYRRFFLYLDFFFLPFGALAFGLFWDRWHTVWARGALLFLLCIQAIFLVATMKERRPVISEETFRVVRSLDSILPDSATIFALENVTPFWLKGWLPNHTVNAPGFFGTEGNEKQWIDFIEGKVHERSDVFYLKTGLYYGFVPQEFFAAYGDSAVDFVNDRCFEPVVGYPLVFTTCTMKQ